MVSSDINARRTFESVIVGGCWSPSPAATCVSAGTDLTIGAVYGAGAPRRASGHCVARPLVGSAKQTGSTESRGTCEELPRCHVTPNLDS